MVEDNKKFKIPAMKERLKKDSQTVKGIDEKGGMKEVLVFAVQLSNQQNCITKRIYEFISASFHPQLLSIIRF